MRKILLNISFVFALLFCFAIGAFAQKNITTNVIDLKLLHSIPVGEYNGVNPILVCDLDLDGKPELVTVQSDYRDNEGRIVVIKGGAFGKQYVIGFGAKYGTPNTSFGYSFCPVAITVVKDGAGRPHGNIYIVAGTAEAKNLYLYRYNSIDDIKEEKVVPLQQNLYGIPQITDFNNDGRKEVFVGTEVFDANSLSLIGYGGGDNNSARHLQHDGSNFSLSTVYSEKSDNEKLLLAGNQLFKVNPSAAPYGVTLETTIGGIPKDGSALVADLNGDGSNEVVVRDIQKRLSVFSVKTNETLILNSPLPMSSYPAVGDIDGDGCDEIVGLKDNKNLSAYKLHFKKGVLYEFWTIKHSDISAQTGITLYDFNNDGIKEIVYRDETLLRIINGSGKSHITGNDTIKNGRRVAYNVASVGLKSSTKSERPIVTDALGNGLSNIVIGGVLYGDYKLGVSRICIFGK